LLICEIAEEWIEDNLERLKSTSNPDSKDYVKFALLKYDEIKQFIASYKAMDWPPVDHLVHLDFLKSSNEFFENVRILGPTGQKGDEPGFRLPEFLYRSLRAIDPF